MPKPILVSGIQPSGKLHIGNYLGALKQFVDLQNSGKYRCFFFVADLHSLTEEFSPKEKRQQILELTADFLAVGLDPKKSTIFLQSQIPAHSELAWILNTITPMGELRRMTQYKEKSDNDRDASNAGLFTYPTLMTADVLLYDATVVPVGDDQDQHLELARTLARKFNTRFGKTFIEPKALHTQAPRVMSLGDPHKKMSKSRPETCVFLDDSPEDILKKFTRAVTDSDSDIRYAPSEKPGVSNLLQVYAGFAETTPAAAEKHFSGKSYSAFKSEIADYVSRALAPFRKAKSIRMRSPASLSKILAAGSKKASLIAQKKMRDVRKRIGISA